MAAPPSTSSRKTSRYENTSAVCVNSSPYLAQTTLTRQLPTMTSPRRPLNHVQNHNVVCVRSVCVRTWREHSTCSATVTTSLDIPSRAHCGKETNLADSAQPRSVSRRTSRLQLNQGKFPDEPRGFSSSKVSVLTNLAALAHPIQGQFLD